MGKVSSSLGFLDLETTGLDFGVHEPWEVGLITRTFKPNGEFMDEEHHWFLPIDLGKADARALEIGGFWDRYPAVESPVRNGDSGTEKVTHVTNFAIEFSKLVRGGMHLITAVTSFDIPRVDFLLRMAHGCPGWHYHTICIESKLLGWLEHELGNIHNQEDRDKLRELITPPYKGEDLFKAIGMDLSQYAKHTAMGDARLIRDAYDRITSNVQVAS